MDTSLTPEEFQEKVAKVIAEKFRVLVRNARKRRGALTELAAQIGVKRTMLDQYAEGSVPGADILFTAFL
jgi:ribosome-binding protein aMBF1 (putative translation factor)